MRKILDYKSFKLNESADQAEVQRLQMERGQAVKDMQAAQAKIADIDVKLAQAQMDAVANAQKVTAPTQATAPSVPATAPTVPAAPVAEGLGIDADGNLGHHELHILDYGFDDGTFWIGFSENFEDDKIVPEDEFIDFIKDWVSHNMRSEDLSNFQTEDESEYSSGSHWSKSNGRSLDAKLFFTEQDRDTQKEIIEDYLNQ